MTSKNTANYDPPKGDWLYFYSFHKLSRLLAVVVPGRRVAYAPDCSSPPALPGKASFPWLFYSAGLSWGGKAAP